MRFTTSTQTVTTFSLFNIKIQKLKFLIFGDRVVPYNARLTHHTAWYIRIFRVDFLQKHGIGGTLKKKKTKKTKNGGCGENLVETVPEIVPQLRRSAFVHIPPIAENLPASNVSP